MLHSMQIGKHIPTFLTNHKTGHILASITVHSLTCTDCWQLTVLQLQLFNGNSTRIYPVFNQKMNNIVHTWRQTPLMYHSMTTYRHKINYIPVYSSLKILTKPSGFCENLSLPSGSLSILSRKGASRSAECGGDGIMWNSPVNYEWSITKYNNIVYIK